MNSNDYYMSYLFSTSSDIYKERWKQASEASIKEILKCVSNIL